MITITTAWFVSLAVVGLLLLSSMSAVHLYHRKELRGYNLTRMQAYAWGMGLYSAAILALALWRGIVGPLAIVDVAALAVCAGLPPIVFRKILPDPEAENTADRRAAIAAIKRNAQEATNG